MMEPIFDSIAYDRLAKSYLLKMNRALLVANGDGFRAQDPVTEILLLEGYQRPVAPKKMSLPVPKISKSKEGFNYEANIFLGFTIPLELAHEILRFLDLRSVGMMLLVNSKTKEQVETMLDYPVLKTHAHETLNLMRQMRLSSHYTIGQIFNEFCQPKCRTCPNFGPFLYIPTMQRCCYECNLYKSSYGLGFVKNICYYFGIEEEDLNDLQLVHNIWLHDPPDCMANISQCKNLVSKLYGPEEAEILDTTVHRIEGEGVYLSEVEPTPYQRHGIPGGGCFWSERKRNRMKFMATVPFPYWDKRAQATDAGVYCTACAYFWRETVLFDGRGPWGCEEPCPLGWESTFRAYREADLPQHVETCLSVHALEMNPELRPHDVN